MRCFVHLHLQKYLAPQWPAIFRHLNSNKFEKHVVFCTFSLTNALDPRATCNFATSELQKVLRACGVFNFLTSKCLLHHQVKTIVVVVVAVVVVVVIVAVVVVEEEVVEEEVVECRRGSSRISGSSRSSSRSRSSSSVVVVVVEVVVVVVGLLK